MSNIKQVVKLYGGDVEIFFDPKAVNRYRLKDGHSPVGVTTILKKTLAKEALMLWPMNMALNHLKQNPDDFDGAAFAHVKKSDYGKDVGSEVHDAIEKALTAVGEGNTELLFMDVSAQAQKALGAFDDWFTKTWPKVLGVEKIVYSRAYDFCGTFDALLEIDGRVVLCDVKTTNPSTDAPLGIYPEYFIQLGAYSLAFREEINIKVDDVMVINASKEGKLSTLRASDVGLEVRNCEDAFLNVLKTYRFLQPLANKLKEGR